MLVIDYNQLTKCEENKLTLKFDKNIRHTSTINLTQDSEKLKLNAYDCHYNFISSSLSSNFKNQKINLKKQLLNKETVQCSTSTTSSLVLITLFC